MSVKLNLGDFIAVLPIGVPITIQYNSSGHAAKYFYGFDSSVEPLDKSVVDNLKLKTNVVQNISVKDGSTWVRGMLVPTKLLNYSDSTDSIFSYLSDKDDIEYIFIAADVESLAVNFCGYLSIKRWLDSAGFIPAPSWVVASSGSNDTQIEYQLSTFYKSLNTSVSSEYISAYNPTYGCVFIYRPNEHKYEFNTLMHIVVKKVSKHIDSSGAIYGDMISMNNETYSVSYSQIVTNNIQSNDVVLLENKHILFSKSMDNKNREKRSNKLTCSFCGKIINVPHDGESRCDDANCLSNCYPNICHTLSSLNLPVMSYDTYISKVKSKEIMCLEDVLCLDEYKDIDVNVTLYELLNAYMPLSVSRNNVNIKKLVSLCNNSKQTLLYYIENSNRIFIDLSIRLTDDILKWMNDSYNQSTFRSLLNLPNVHIEENSKLFDGAPIFRNVTILVTGQFRHGEISRVCAILKSYEAKVVTEWCDNVSLVLIGDIKQNISGSALMLAKKMNIPVYEELDFFNRFDIDDDISKNLL